MKISVIIPALNEERYIAGCIEAVQDQQDFKDHEIIVVDNGSHDHTSVIAHKMGVKVVKESRRGLPQARETGRKIARGEILVFIDADMLIPPKYLVKVYKTFKTHPKVVITSNPFYFYDSSLIMNLLLQFFFRGFLPVFRLFLKIMRMPMLIFGGNFAVRAEAIERIGGFDTHIKFYGEDADLAKRIAPAGKIKYLPNLFSGTSARRFVKEGLVRTCLNYIVNYFAVFWRGRPVFWRRENLLFRTLRVLLFCFVAWSIIYVTSNPLSQLAGQVTYKINTLDKEIALTFDDGPNGLYTQEVLDILARERVKATFFLIGKNVETYPDLVREMVRNGHVIGNHTYTHPWRLPFENKKGIWYELIQTEEAIFKVTGQRPGLFRPPHGLRTPWMLRDIAEAGYKIYTWDDMTDDYVFRTRSTKIVKHILAKVQPGTIIVLHDGLNLDHKTSRENTITALPQIIDALKKDGYHFVLLN